MRCLKRNEVPFYYCLFDKKVPITDGEGYESGEYRNVYKAPVKIYGNVSAAQGAAQIEQFGTSIDYTKVIILEDAACPIDENTVLFVDREPTFDANENPLFDYVVTKVAKSRNSGISYAISKVR